MAPTATASGGRPTTEGSTALAVGHATVLRLLANDATTFYGIYTWRNMLRGNARLLITKR